MQCLFDCKLVIIVTDDFSPTGTVLTASENLSEESIPTLIAIEEVPSIYLQLVNVEQQTNININNITFLNIFIFLYLPFLI